METIEKIKEYIENRLEELNPKQGEFSGKPLRKVNPRTFPRESELERIQKFISSLEKEQEPQGLDEVKLKSEIEWEWVHREKQETDFIPCAEMDKDEFIRFAKKFFEIGKDAGAKWMAEQGETIETRFTKTKFRGLIAIRSFHKDGEYFKNGEEVIIQIRKKEK